MATVRLISSPQTRLSSLESPKAKMRLHTQDATHIIKKENILYLKSSSNYCEVYFVDGKKMCCSQTMKSIEAKIKDFNFFRVHNSYVVNINYLKKVNSSFSELFLLKDVVIPISRSNKSSLKKKLDFIFD